MTEKDRIRVRNQEEDPYKPGFNQSLIYEFPITDREIILPDGAFLGGIYNCNDTKDPKIVATEGDVWATEVFRSKIKANRSVITSEDIKSSHLIAGEGIEARAVYHDENYGAKSILEVTSTLDISQRKEKEKESEEYQRALIETMSGMESYLRDKLGLKIPIKEILKNGTMKKLLQTLGNKGETLAGRELNQKYMSYLETLQGLREVNQFLTSNQFGYGVIVNDYLQKGTIIRIGDLERTMPMDIKVPEDKVARFHIVNGKIREQKIDAPEIPLELKVQEQLE